jgi:hypothetical protein
MKQWVQVSGFAGDLQLAYDYFRQKGGVAAATRFLTRYEHCVAAVTAHPKLGAIRGHGWRQKPIPNSTFSIFYGERGKYWMLVGIQSTVQDPDRIQASLLIREIGESQT